MLYEGKAKQVFATEDPEIVMVHYKDDATAFKRSEEGHHHRQGRHQQPGHQLYDAEAGAGRGPHPLRPGAQRARHPGEEGPDRALEVIIRNISAGSFAKRFGVEEGIVFENPTIEYSYKNDDLGDPMINTAQALALKLATPRRDRDHPHHGLQGQRGHEGLLRRGGRGSGGLKLEFGRLSDGTIVLADEISPDTCRFWDSKTHEKLDKDRFRRDLGGVEDAYAEMRRRIFGA